MTRAHAPHSPGLTRAGGPPLRDGPYRTEGPLGRGGMAVVHLARRANGKDTGERFAVKRMTPQLATSPAYVRMFRREGRLGSLLNHPNVVRVLDFGEQEGELLMVTEYVQGSSCSRMLRLVADRGEVAPLPVVLYIVCEVLEALEYVHGLLRSDGSRFGIVHRDLSPGNILLGATGSVKLADFGVALWEDGNRETVPGVVKGKVRYMSPEQIDGGLVDRRGDLFSLGAVAFEMLVGAPLFTGNDDLEVLARMREGALASLCGAPVMSIPLELRLILATAVARERTERFDDASEFLRALRAFARHVAVVNDRNALVTWLRRFDVWPVRSGEYPAFRAAAPAANSTEAACTERGDKPRV